MDLVQKVDESLTDSLEGTVPFGAWQNLLTKLLTEYLKSSGTTTEILTTYRTAKNE